eukprot:jgi/Mesen1/4822/ME000243S03996
MDPKAPVEGFLYALGPTRTGGSYCHLLYVVLAGRFLSLYKSKGEEAPLRSGVLDMDLRVEDTGRQIVSGQTLYTLRLYSTTEQPKEVQLGATSSEETAAWIDAITSALEQPLVTPPQEPQAADASTTGASGDSFPMVGPLSGYYPPQVVPPPAPQDVEASDSAAGGAGGAGAAAASPSRALRSRQASYTQLLSTTIGAAGPTTPLLPRPPSAHQAPGQAGVSTEGAAASRWRLVRCSNSLRYFEEINDSKFVHTFYKLRVMKCVGVVKAAPSAIFDLVMHYGEERMQWDPTVDGGQVIETKDGHTDVVFVQCRHDWIWLRPRDLCLWRYWKREDNGSYVVFYKSVEHPKCPKRRGNSTQGGKPRSLVEHVLEMDAGGWSSWFGIGLSSYPAHLRNGLLCSVGGIREYFAAQRVNSSATTVHRQFVDAPDLAMGGATTPAALAGVQQQQQGGGAALTSFLDAEDVEEFFDAGPDNWSESSDGLRDEQPQVTGEWLGIVVEGASPPPAASSLSLFPDYLTGDWRAGPPTSRAAGAGGVEWSKYGGSVPMGPLKNGRHCWSQPDGNLFAVRSRSHLMDGSRVPAGEPMSRLVAVDWFRADDKIEHIARRRQSIVQRVALKYSGVTAPYFFLINLQVPQGADYISLVFYFAIEKAIPEGSLLHRFIHGDDTFRNSRLTLIAIVPEGSWLVKQAVGSRPVPLGQIMAVKYHTGTNYTEVDVNMGSSSVVRGVMGLVFGYITMLVVDMAFLIKADSEEELPERLIGAVRCSHIDLAAAVPPMPAS